jgi:hypothetical protein
VSLALSAKHFNLSLFDILVRSLRDDMTITSLQYTHIPGEDSHPGRKYSPHEGLWQAATEPPKSPANRLFLIRLPPAKWTATHCLDTTLMRARGPSALPRAIMRVPVPLLDFASQLRCLTT